jgi:hypothetical protein
MTSLCLALIGCVTPRAEYAPSKFGETYPVRTTPDGIEIFRSQNPSKKYVEIGSVSVCCDLRMDYAVKLMRQAASDKGGDAIIGLDATANGLVMATVVRYQ